MITNAFSFLQYAYARNIQTCVSVQAGNQTFRNESDGISRLRKRDVNLSALTGLIYCDSGYLVYINNL